ncbi:hypothetical protein INT44_000272 [Umbelopsis vinacea]|uniref:Yeast cell wall synthesis Kre9/Knh1-like N-terminal domain-containing protein n=1 Tax=Umbelopsis vinacea TaxID=44442 RepID=A0A8H7UDT8_9FUNG|nr:hypothetical protein INT44_000272 [Umbelopsis vinacea]
MKSIVAAIAAFAIAAVSAQTTPVSLTSPLTGTVYTAGTNAIISWINPSVATISQIELVKGPSSALQPVLTVTTNVNAADMKYTWAIPADTAAGTDYAFELGTSPNIAYSGFFTIQAASGAAASSNSSAAADSSSAASSSMAASSAPASSSMAASSSSMAATTSAAASSAPASSSAAASSAAATTKASGASALKAGVVGAGLVAGAAALLL